MKHHLDWLLELTQIPTASGREDRVVAWVREWASQRSWTDLDEDAGGNLTLRFKGRDATGPAVFFTAHLDHPAFVVDRIVGPGTLQLTFRGGVMDDYFHDARIIVHPREGGAIPAVLTGAVGAQSPGGLKSYTAEIDGDVGGVRVGDVAVWDLPPSEMRYGLLHAPACDDLAAAAAALAAFEALGARAGGGEAIPDVRVLLTRAEEIGFIGAIAACRLGTIPHGSRLLALENSRAFDESPIGGGPIVRVGDRMTIFSPSLTDACAQRAEETFGGASQPRASEKKSDLKTRPWQRKLMAGGACEATVFCAYGYEATCLCLPLGNYHNMGDLTAVQAGTNTRRATIEPECIAIADYEGLVDLLVACGERLPEGPKVMPRLEKLWNERSFVLGEQTHRRL